MRKRFAMTNTLLAIALVAAGCASSGATGTSSAAAANGPTYTLSITVDNDLSSGGIKPVTASVLRTSGSSKILGVVDAGRKKTFTYEAPVGTYFLTVRTTTPTDPNPYATSQPIQVTGPMAVTWHLQSNSLIEGQ